MATPKSADANKGEPNKVSFIISPYIPWPIEAAKNKNPISDIIKLVFIISPLEVIDAIFVLKT
jgi:S-adenosylmethionine synthetase